ncbi:MAG: dihydrofolate reductase [Deltaproteobacteria bacterium]|nr:dihydrofolate reductase [Deltaproteobacteria bacterium]
MSKLRVNSYSISLDGFGAAPGQSLENPFGIGGMEVVDWFAATQTFHDHLGVPGKGSTGTDDAVAAAALQGLGAWIMGRNMFTPSRGPWPDDNWKGWWGPNPVYHAPVFVLTHHARPPLEMEGGTVFHFVTGGIEEALVRARAAAGGKDVRVGGGAATIRHYLQAGLIDELHLAISPVVLGAGEAPLAGVNLPALGYYVAERKFGENAMHVFIRKRG